MKQKKTVQQLWAQRQKVIDLLVRGMNDSVENYNKNVAYEQKAAANREAFIERRAAHVGVWKGGC